MSIDFRDVFKALPGLFVVIRTDAPRYTVVEASDAYLASSRVTREGLVGHGLFEVFFTRTDPAAAETGRCLRASLEKVIATRAPDVMAMQQYDLDRPGGPAGARDTRYWSPLNAPIVEGGAVTHVIHNVVDVTDFIVAGQRVSQERGRSEALLARAEKMEAEVYLRSRQIEEVNQKLQVANDKLAETSEAQFRALFDFMPQLGWTAQPGGFIDFYNRGWYEYTGTTYDEMQGWGWQSVHDPEMLPRVMEGWTDALRRQVAWEMEFPLRRHDGTFRWFMTRVNPIRNAAGEIVRWVGINTDIHDRKVAGAQTELRMRLLLESIYDYAIFMLAPDGTVATWSRGAERIKGYQAEEVIGKPISIFYLEDDRRNGKTEKELAIAAASGRFEEEGWRVRKSGERFWANVVITAVRDDQGALVGFAKVTRDLTEKRAVDEERARRVQAEEGVKLRDEFLTIASHELKTPLTALQLQLQSIALRIDTVDTRLAARFQRATVSADRLGALVETLLDVARITAGRLTLERRTLDLGQLVREVADRFSEQARVTRSPIAVTVEGAAAGDWDRTRLEQVLTNLLGNALKYAAGQPIDVVLRSDGKEAVLTVADHGPGIAAADLPRLFGRFERASSIQHYGGLGLGLYISREIIEAHGGTIEVQSELGEGAIFTVRLPIHPPTASC